MPKPSVFKQVNATAIAKNSLKNSPRHWNNGLFRYRDRLWMAYRFHLMTAGGRCKTAVCPIDERTLQPSGPSQMLDLPDRTGDEHQEDARLFLYRGVPHVSYTAMVGYQPGVDFKCVMKYARLSLIRDRWKVEEDWLPRYGRNDWRSKEKNWVFFESGGKLHCIYADDPEHTILEIDGDRVAREYRTPKPAWEWGIVRGGTPPLLMEDGSFITVFHSSIPREKKPHWVRYFSGFYRFGGDPPFRLTGISPKPILSASEEDGHEVDPRYIEGWKPYVVFPAGLVETPLEYLVSFGINDWQSAIARIPKAMVTFVPPDGSAPEPRYFRKSNGSLPVALFNPNSQSKVYYWSVPTPGPGCSAGEGYTRIINQREAEEVLEHPDVTEISEREYRFATRNVPDMSLSVR